MLALSAFAAGVPILSLAQERKVWRVGFFLSGSRGSGELETAFLAGMKDHGYDVGRNLVVDTRYAEGDTTRYSKIADELVSLKPDALVVTSTGNAIVLNRKTSTIPIVLGSAGDPVGAGLVQSLARPGGNVTGNALQLSELSAKQVELLAEVLPRMRRVALLVDASQEKAANEQVERLASAAANAKGASLQVHRIDSAEAIRQLFRTAEIQRADALLLVPTPRFNVLRREICRSAASVRLPLIGFSDEWALDGALMSFGPNWAEAYRRVAYFVDRIFKGARPGDLPLEQPTKFSLVINSRTAKALGVKVPQSILLRADRVIE